jgi:HPt (histidine-containing phosphotransfer) domain-containing protein
MSLRSAKALTPATPAPDLSEALIDLEVLEELRETMPPPLFASMTRQFLSETGETLADLSAAARNDAKPEKLAEDVHRLAGSAAVFGATRFRNELIAQERRALKGEASALAEGFADLTTVWEETRTGLVKLLEKAA